MMIVRPEVLENVGWVPLILAVFTVFKKSPASSTGTPIALGWQWWSLVALFVVFFRWSSIWIPYELNPDEGQLIAGGYTLRHDPLFWRSVDGHTAGPFDFYPLLAVAWSDGCISLAIARCLGLVGQLAVLFCIGEALSIWVRPIAARMAVLPAALFYAFTRLPDFLFYSTEIAPLVLMAIATRLFARYITSPARWRLWIVSVLLGAVPWAKLQAIPIAAAIWTFVVLYEMSETRSRSIGIMLIGGLIPSLFVTGVNWLFGRTEDMVIPYLLNSLFRIGEPELKMATVCSIFWRLGANDGYLVFLVLGAFVSLVVALTLLGSSHARLRALLLCSTALLAVTIVCIVAPRRPFVHYLQFAVIPLLLVSGSALEIAWQYRPNKKFQILLLGAFLGCSVILPIGHRTRLKPIIPPNYVREPPLVEQALITAVRTYTLPGESLGIWGWRSSLYVAGGLWQATRDGQTEPQIIRGPWQSYFLRRYITDLQHAEPPVFVDTVGRGNFRFPFTSAAHESFRLLDAWIRKKYTMILLAGGTRVYVRNDRLRSTGNGKYHIVVLRVL